MAEDSPSLGVSSPSSTTTLQVLLLMVMLASAEEHVYPRRSRRAVAMAGRRKPPGDVAQRQAGETGTDIACVKLGGVHVIPIACPKIAREVLKRHERQLRLPSTDLRLQDTLSCPLRRPLEEDAPRARLGGRVPVSPRVAPRQARRGGRQPHPLQEGTLVDVRHVARHYCGNVVRRLVFNRRYFGEAQPDGGPGPPEVQHVDAVFASVGLSTPSTSPTIFMVLAVEQWKRGRLDAMPREPVASPSRVKAQREWTPFAAMDKEEE
ncbi:hypothetical protein HU200_011518 [Digitaria exilis]|uniref:Uncharacterized protein n=1 Tax=Digitaria exilis TaxID=1010633 RepID=A0A835FGI4_9POAL|nr:hypothetical protein HU200_011518 [Digitaria exilis]